MPAPFISYRVLSDIKVMTLTLTSDHASTGRVDVTGLGTITPLMLSIDRVFLVFNIDYHIINDSGSVFLEFLNEMAPAGVSAVEAGEVITFLYSAEPV